MRASVRRGLVWGALGIAALLGRAGMAEAANCALYARAITGVSLFGAAGGWWNEAAGLYQRGSAPDLGAILVFRRSGQMPSGHVAVVSGIINSREVLIDHANWYRGTVTRHMEAIDTSPYNDWTSVAVRDLRSGQFGRNSPTYGFVYPNTGPRGIVETRSAAAIGYDSDATDSGLPARWRPQRNFVRVALVADDRHHRTRQAKASRSAHHAAARSTHRSSRSASAPHHSAVKKPVASSHTGHGAAKRTAEVKRPRG
jgi:surface antigen